MFQEIETYLAALRQALAKADPAIVQDALADAEEHLTSALSTVRERNPQLSTADAMAGIIASYGTAEEIAAGYLDLEAQTRPVLAVPTEYYERSLASRFFGVIYDPSAWGALLYMVISMPIGILYFTWVTTGLYLSIGLLLLIIGLPVAYLFLLSFRGIALVEGRIVEGLLGVRMPRRPIFSDRNLTWWEQLKVLVKSGRTWLVILYMLLRMPLGVINFTVGVVGLALALDAIAVPITQGIFGHPFIMLDSMTVYLGTNVMPLVVLLGLLFGVLVMHLTRILAKWQAKMARAMLIGK